MTRRQRNKTHKSHSLGSALVGAGTAVAAFVAAPVVVPALVGLLGFGAAGISAGSAAAGLMASYGGTVATGSLCAVLQSVGAAGITSVGAAAVAVPAGVAASRITRNHGA